MFASLSRPSSKATRSYICSSCLCNILTPPTLNRPTTAGRALFSSTAIVQSQDGEQSADTTPASITSQNQNGTKSKNADTGSAPAETSKRSRRKRMLGRLKSHKVSNASLFALRNALEAGEQHDKRQELQEERIKAVKPKSSSKIRKVGTTNPDIKSLDVKKLVEERKEKQEKSSKDDGSNLTPTPPKPTKSSKPKPHISKPAKKKVTEPVVVPKKGAKKAASASSRPAPGTTVKGKKKAGPLVRVVESRLKVLRIPSNYSPGILPITERKRMVKDIQDGNLPDHERRKVLRALRNSLLRQVQLSKEELEATRSLEGGLPGRGLKDAMLHPEPEGRGSRSTRPSGPFSEQRVGVEVAYKVGAPRAGNSAPLERAAPGRENALPPKFLRSAMTTQEVKTVQADDLALTPIDAGPLDVPHLAYGLERALFNPGVYQLQDPRTRVYNFDPYLQTIMPVEQFDFNALKEYITSSRDDTLLGKAAAEKMKYTGSTSSMTSALAHFHFLLSQWRLINVGNLSKMFPVQYHTFTAIQRGPISIFLRWRNGVYAIDADKQFDSASVLSMLGKSMEKLLTLPTDHFEKYRKGKSDQITEEERNEPEAFHYTTMGDFMMRSQLDAYDSRLPGTGMFDLKTRAVISVRMDTDGYEEGRGYQIHQRHGEWESFEREYYDMIRSAFLKYSLQVRMGRMDGIFVAFHNTERIFGFQYISLEEMDQAIHGTSDKRLGDAEFKLSVDLLNRVLDRATAKYPEQSLRIHFETRDAVTPFMYIFAEPVDETRINEIQGKTAGKIEAFEKRVLGLDKKELDQQRKQAQWEELRAQVEKTMDQDEHGPERSVEELEGDEEGMTEEERHQIKALVSSNRITEDPNEDAEEEENESLVEEEEGEELEEGHEETASEVMEEDEITEGEHEESVSEIVEEDVITEEEPEVFASEPVEEGEITEEEQKESASEVSEDGEVVEEIEGDNESVSGVAEDGEIMADQEQAANELAEDGEATEDEHIESAEATSGDEISTVGSEQDTDASDSATSIDVEEAETKDGLEETTAQDDTEADIIFEDEDADVQTEGTATYQALQRPPQSPRDILAMTLTIQNKVDGKYVAQPDENNYPPGAKWEVEYALAEVDDLERANLLYKACRTRRKMIFGQDKKAAADSLQGEFLEKIKEFARKGRVWRDRQTKIEKELPIKTLDPMPSHEDSHSLNEQTEKAEENEDKKSET